AILQAIESDLKQSKLSLQDMIFQFIYYSAPCKSSEINKDKPSHLTLERRCYNPNYKYLTLEVDCVFIQRYLDIL
ncbi:6685_t:CDS:1, partial [Dentiscutata heterogama]